MNTDLMIAIREQIKMRPELHYQGSWVSHSECGTRHCIAGWAAVLRGHVLNEESDTVDGVPIETWAQKVLDLTSVQAIELFYCFDNASALEILDEYIEEGKNSDS